MVRRRCRRRWRISLHVSPGSGARGLLRGRRTAKLLSPGPPAAGCLGLLARAEPPRALADLHLDLRVPAAGGRVIDAFACAVDITLDRALRRGRDRPRSRCQQDRMGALRWLGGSQDHRLLVADAPVPRRDERALPHAGLGLARGLFVGIVIVGNARIAERPPVLHHPLLDVLAIDLAMGNAAAAPVGLADMTGPALVAGVVNEFVARGDAA